MKIAIIEDKLNLETGGGTNQYVHVVASELVRLGHQVTLITLDSTLNAYPDNLPYTVVAEDLIFNRIDRKYRVLLLKVLYKYQNQFDIYHLGGPQLLMSGAIYRRLGGKVPVVVNLMGFTFCWDFSRLDMNCARHCTLKQRILHQRENPVLKALLLPFRALECCIENLMANHVDAFLPVTEPLGDVYACHHLNRQKMTVIPVPVDYDYLSQLNNNHNRTPSPDKRYNILYIGRLAIEKGVDILIRAILKLDFPVHLHIAGDGPQRNELELLAKELGIADRITFHGWVPHEKIGLLHLNSQLFVHPARWPELFCLSVVEAMAFGMPIIVADHDDATSALNDAGLTFKRNDPDDLAEKIRLIYDTPSLATAIAQKAQERAREFDYENVVNNITEVYKHVTNPAKLREIQECPMTKPIDIITEGSIDTTTKDPLGQSTKVSVKVSVVIPVYNGERYVAEAIKSVLSQSYKDFEVIVVDDGSTDNTPEIVSSFPVKYFRQENQGNGAARNRGVELSHGQYIAFLDADDVRLKDSLEKNLEILERHPEAAYSYGQVYFMDENGRIFGLNKSPLPNRSCIRKGMEDIQVFLTYGNHFTLTTAMFRRSCLDEGGMFDPTFRLGSTDLDMWVRLAKRYAGAYIAEPLGVYRIHKHSITAVRKVAEIEKSNSRVIENIFNDVEFGPIFYPKRAFYYSRFYLRLATYAYEKGEMKTARDYLLRSLQMQKQKLPRSLVPSWALLFAKTLIPKNILILGRRPISYLGRITWRLTHRFHTIDKGTSYASSNP